MSQTLNEQRFINEIERDIKYVKQKLIDYKDDSAVYDYYDGRLVSLIYALEAYHAYHD